MGGALGAEFLRRGLGVARDERDRRSRDVRVIPKTGGLGVPHTRPGGSSAGGGGGLTGSSVELGDAEGER